LFCPAFFLLLTLFSFSGWRNCFSLSIVCYAFASIQVINDFDICLWTKTFLIFLFVHFFRLNLVAVLLANE
jgi:hypothetical protein